MTVEFSPAVDSATLHSVRIGKTRQLTLSAYRQLDRVHPDKITPWGRVKDAQDRYADIFVIGKSRSDGTLVRASTSREVGLIPLEPEEVDAFGFDEDESLAGVPRPIERVFSGRIDYFIPFFDPCWGRTLGVSVPGCNRERLRGHQTFVRMLDQVAADEIFDGYQAEWAAQDMRHEEWSALPLIILGGLR